MQVKGQVGTTMDEIIESFRELGLSIDACLNARKNIYDPENDDLKTQDARNILLGEVRCCDEDVLEKLATHEAQIYGLNVPHVALDDVIMSFKAIGRSFDSFICTHDALLKNLDMEFKEVLLCAVSARKEDIKNWLKAHEEKINAQKKTAHV